MVKGKQILMPTMNTDLNRQGVCNNLSECVCARDSACKRIYIGPPL